MKSLVSPTALLAGFGALMFMGTVATTVPAAAKCMIDEGNGRRTPCDAMFIKSTTSTKPLSALSTKETVGVRRATRW